MAFYYNDDYLGATSEEAARNMTKSDRKAVVYDYLTSDFTLEDLASFIIDAEVFPNLQGLTEDALDNLYHWASQGYAITYGGVEWDDDDKSSNRRPKASQCRRNGTSGKKAPAKKTSKPKASNARKKAPAKASSRRY